MNLVKCENDHFYDSDKFLSCPHCANRIAEPEIEDVFGAGQEFIPTLPRDTQGGVGHPERVSGRTVGWLVCIDGVLLGESYVIREGENCIGRDAGMDVPLLYEPTVSRNRHAAITYDPARNSSVLHAQGNNGQVLCNGKDVKSRKTLKSHDVITLGSCSLLFIALCGAQFRWSEEEER